MKNQLKISTIVLFSALCVFSCSAASKSEAERNTINFGVLVDEENSQVEIPVRYLTWNNRIKRRSEIDADVRVLPKVDCYNSARFVCSLIESDTPPVAIFAAESPVYSGILQSICSNLSLPYVQTSWKIPGTFKGGDTSVNLHPDFGLVSRGLAMILKSLHWDTFYILYEEVEGLMRLQEVLKLGGPWNNMGRSEIIPRRIAPGEDYRILFKELRDSRRNQFVLDCATERIPEILKQARAVGMMEYYHSYLLTSFDAHTLDLTFLETRANITMVRILDYEDVRFAALVQDWERSEFRYGKAMKIKPSDVKTETALIYDAANLLLETLNQMGDKEVSDHLQKTVSCSNAEEPSTFGTEITSTMKIMIPHYTMSGPIELDETGRRTNFNIYVADGRTKKTVATWNAKEPNGISLNATVDERIEAYLERVKNSSFRVSIIIIPPFTMLKTPRFENETLTGNDRFEGFTIDFMDAIGKLVDYSFEYHLSKDGTYGGYDQLTGEFKGLIGDVINYEATFAAGDLTITTHRKKIVDFSVPFMTLSVGLLMKEIRVDIGTFDFLKPFSEGVWFYTGTFYLIVTIVLWLIARMAPADWENPDPREQPPKKLENMWNIKNCFWLTMGSVMNQGSDIYPKGISSRQVTAMWWFFSLIMTNSYMASLAAFLTNQQQGQIKSLEALVSQNKVKYGVLSGGATDQFFAQSNIAIYKKMYETMLQAEPPVFEDSIEDGVRRVTGTKAGDYGFFLETTQIDYYTEVMCELKDTKIWLMPRALGIVMRQDSEHRSKINKAILKLQSEGFINQLKTKWWKERRTERRCPSKKKKGAELDLEELGGVFMILGVGVAVAILLGICEFLWAIRRVSVKQHVNLWTAFRIEGGSALKVWSMHKRIKSMEADLRTSRSEIVPYEH